MISKTAIRFSLGYYLLLFRLHTNCEMPNNARKSLFTQTEYSIWTLLNTKQNQKPKQLLQFIFIKYVINFTNKDLQCKHFLLSDIGKIGKKEKT